MTTLDETRVDAAALERIVGEGNVLAAEPLSRHCTFRIGGPARLFARPQDERALAALIATLRESGEPYLVVGKGSNLLFPDDGYDGVIVEVGRAMGGIVLSAEIELTPDDPDAIQGRMADLDERRRTKQPLEYPSAGSTFKRPPGHYASALVDEAGLKGWRAGGAAVSEKHAGFVVNLGDATCADVLAVIAHAQDVVRERFGVELEPEVRIVENPRASA